jgi:hypothetical protein
MPGWTRCGKAIASAATIGLPLASVSRVARLCSSAPVRRRPAPRREPGTPAAPRPAAGRTTPHSLRVVGPAPAVRIAMRAGAGQHRAASRPCPIPSGVAEPGAPAAATPPPGWPARRSPLAAALQRSGDCETQRARDGRTDRPRHHGHTARHQMDQVKNRTPWHADPTRCR